MDQLELEQIQGGVYDVSSHNDGAVFESLSTLLNNVNLSTLIPISVRHGGMSIRFIQGSVPSSDNMYVQYRLMSSSWSISVADWQGVDDVPTAGSNNLVKSGGVKGDFNAINHSLGDYSVTFNESIKQKYINLPVAIAEGEKVEVTLISDASPTTDISFIFLGANNSPQHKINVIGGKFIYSADEVKDRIYYYNNSDADSISFSVHYLSGSEI